MSSFAGCKLRAEELISEQEYEATKKKILESA